MARPELNTQLTEPKPYHDVEVQWAIRFDRANFADAILNQVGNDHSTDHDPLWEAEWSADSLGKNIFLRREVFNDDIDIYWIGVSDYDAEQAVWYGFTREYACISWMPNEEVDSEDIGPEEDLALWRQLVKELDIYLDTAPIRRASIERDPYWRELFDDVILSVYADDAEIKEYVIETALGVEYSDRAMDQLIGRLCLKHRLDDFAVQELISRAEYWASEGMGIYAKQA